jgi:Leucine-rich repeat (LRR) protein
MSNRIKEVDVKALENLRELRVLNLADNQIEQVPRIGRLFWLKQLSLHGK